MSEVWATFEQFSVVMDASRLLGCHPTLLSRAHAASGGGFGLSPSIRRRIAANSTPQSRPVVPANTMISIAKSGDNITIFN